jgi:hypothetical protein
MHTFVKIKHMNTITLAQYAEDLKISKMAAWHRIFRMKDHPGIIGTSKLGTQLVLYKSDDYQDQVNKFEKKRK